MPRSPLEQQAWARGFYKQAIRDIPYGNSSYVEQYQAARAGLHAQLRQEPPPEGMAEKLLKAYRQGIAASKSYNK